MLWGSRVLACRLGKIFGVCVFGLDSLLLHIKPHTAKSYTMSTTKGLLGIYSVKDDFRVGSMLNAMVTWSTSNACLLLSRWKEER